MQSFEAQVTDWVRETKARTRAVFLDSTQTLFFDVTKTRGEGGNMRVDTGFLRSSAEVTLNNPVLRQEPNPDDSAVYAFDSGPIALTIAGADAGDTIFMTFTANYARAREYGARGQAPDAFVAANVARWQDIVTASALKIQRSVEARAAR